MSLKQVLNDLLPDPVRFGESDPRQLYPLIGAEQAAVTKAVQKRRCAFSAGRHAARLALGLPDAEIPVGEKRMPLWPEGFCGSISHSDTLCLAVAAQRADYRSLGVDVEEDEPLKEALRPAILHPDERLASCEEAIAIFSRKEALFKALYPIAREWFGFQDAACEGEHLILQRALGPFAKGQRFAVPARRAQGHVISFCAVKGVGA